MIYTDWKFDENTKTVYNVPMGSWVDIDIWPKGKAGFDARYRVDGDRLFIYCLEGAHERGVSGVSADSRILSIGGNHGKGDG